MKVAIFGASGATGRLLTAHCLDAGHSVTSLVRSPETYRSAFLRAGEHEVPGLRIVAGSVFDSFAVRSTIEGADVALSALGAHSPLRNENVLPRAVPIIVAAMQQFGVRRIIALGSAGILADSLKKQPAWRRWIVENIVYKTVLKWPVTEQIAQYRILFDSNLDWTMVMPPMLTNSYARGRYRIDGEALPRNGSRISRADVASFMMKQITDPQWIRKGVYITW